MDNSHSILREDGFVDTFFFPPKTEAEFFIGNSHHPTDENLRVVRSVWLDLVDAGIFPI